MTLSLDTAYRSFGGEVEASSTPTICRLPDSRRHQLSAIAPHEINTPVGTSLTVASAFINKTNRFEADVASGNVRRSTLTEFIAASREAASQVMVNLGNAA